ncbi:HAD family hydrolase [Hydrogenimonas thermophila]|uniref:phosphoglycolate phosphatase n=1 Tax=Hydrogenimonas thermophila TaxID=223786 RepID=A0A1I5PP67_9BACT|nr:HAD family hydrolase [Hydrogenimonas thermophila]WOE71093.1 HAD family hydrolase [Hydrogenimonas thermophila]WOE73611.1 HAD family hydrolase [Hydrogenimonas thermophila]SFP35932.1 phosphoglycolate phosphatase [Hydrogenimonas thermophila]
MKTVIFDLDGTLVDTHADITASINHVRREIYGLEPMSADEITKLMNIPGLNLAYEFYGVKNYEPEAENLFEEHYSKQCLLNAKTFDGIIEVLDHLLGAKCELFVATNAPTVTSKLILQNNGIERCFKDIVGADLVKNPKPHPEMIHKICEAANYDEIWMIGDSPKDIMAAEQANVNAIFASWGYSKVLPKEMSHIKSVSKPLELTEILF